MTKNDPPNFEAREVERREPHKSVVSFPGAMPSHQRSRNDGDDETPTGRAGDEQDATTLAQPHGSASTVKGGQESLTAVVPLPSSVTEKTNEHPSLSDQRGQIRIAGSATSSSQTERSDLARHRTNAAARPILKAYARRKGLLSPSLEAAIDSPTTIKHPAIARELGGALQSEALRNAITANSDHSLVPLNIRASQAKMINQNLSDPPPVNARRAFPDWDKPIAPFGQHHRVWHAEDAARWLDDFPPNGRIPHPMNTWDDVTAARWLNDRNSISAHGNEGGKDDIVVIDPSRSMKPSLQVLHDLNDLELEELAYRVFVEQWRRDVMPVLISQRRIHIQDVLLDVTIGYRSLDDARRSVHGHDVMWIKSFDNLFHDSSEWIYDLCCRILALYAWPTGFSEPELQSDYA